MNTEATAVETVETPPAEAPAKPKRERKPKAAKALKPPPKGVEQGPRKPKAKATKKASAKEAPEKKHRAPKALKELPGRQTTPRKVGPAMLALKDKIKPKEKWEKGVCKFKSCTTKSATPRAKWCKTHAKEIRKAQLSANNETWIKRVKKGEAGHHVAYRGKPTEWAVENPKQALRLVENGASVVDAAKFAPQLAKVIAQA